MTGFSLLMCLYAKENPDDFRQCLESIDRLNIMPAEIIIVKDGPLTDELEEVLKSHDFLCAINIIALPENVTLGPARAIGVEAAKNEWVAIMDTDDICRPDRFDKQFNMIVCESKLGLIGGQISEFMDASGNEETAKNVPLTHEEIVRFAKVRNPFNHMTVMFRRDEVLAAGNYRYFPYFEDYDLWTRMINNGTMCANHSDILVDARTDSGTYARRRGLAYIRLEVRLQKQLRSLGITTGFEYFRNILLRVPVRLLPGRMLAGLYRGLLRNNLKGKTG